MTVVEERDLWDMPALLLLLGMLILGEWDTGASGGWRETRGSAYVAREPGSRHGCRTADPPLGRDRAWCDAEYSQQFHSWAATLIDAATTRYEVPTDNVIYLGEKPDLAPELISDRSSRENVEGAIDTIAGRAAPSDHVVIVLFGHGSFTDTARINLPGRDLSADDFAGLLDRLSGQQVTFVNTASATDRSSRNSRAMGAPS